MLDTYLLSKGQLINGKDLTYRWAKELLGYLKTEISCFAKLVECRITDDGKELIVIDIDVEVGQHTVYDIRHVERICIEFSNEHSNPEILAMRRDFPLVPHTNLRESEIPRSLCLFEEGYDDLKLYWTPAFFIKRVRGWLNLTARGELHQADQPLEPLMLLSGIELVIPFNLFQNGDQMAKKMKIYRADNRKDGLTLIAQYSTPSDRDDNKNEYIAIPIRGQAQVHGVINHLPKTLQELHDFLLNAQINLINEIKKYLTTILTEENYTSYAKSKLILIVDLPKKRSEGAVSENAEIWAFCFRDSIESVGVSLGVWALNVGTPGFLFDGKISDTMMKVDPMNVMLSFSREMASALNNIIPDRTPKITLIGVGALGSQLFVNLIRAGYGKWILIDNDHLLPHNLARHILFRGFVGNSKAEYLSMLANDMLGEQEASRYIVADILNPGIYKENMETSLNESDIIVDISTSIAVARYLARDCESEARRVSLFLTLSGEDSVMLIEDKNRQIRLDILEMQYYRLLLHNENLKTHLSKFSGKIRYANSCRDITSTVPQDMVALHAAICSRALREYADKGDAYIKIWRFNQSELKVESFAFDGIKTIEKDCNQWKICTDQYLIDKVCELRTSKLPNETGGILIGSFDMVRKIVYIMDVIPSPPDSEEWPIAYIRGFRGLSEQLENVADITAGRLQYVGEWHSHPDGCITKPSSDDKVAFNWLNSHMSIDGFPAVMLIVGQYEYSLYVENIDEKL